MAGSKKKKPSSTKKSKKSPAKNSKPIQLDDVLSKAESAMEMSDLETALKLFTYAAEVLRSRVHGCDGSGNDSIAEIRTNSIEGDKKTLATVLGKIGELKAANGDVEGARREFLDAIELLGPNQQNNGSSALSSLDGGVTDAQNCESRAGLHLYLGQLSCGEEALGSLRVGVSELEQAINILEKLIETNETASTMTVEDVKDTMGLADLKRFLIETRKQLCSAFCSIAELYLTDLCDEPDAESCCEKALQSALKLDKIATEASEEINNNNAMDVDGENQKIEPPQPDALQTMANLRLSQSRGEEALVYIMKAYSRMKVGCEAMSSLVGLGKDAETRDGGKAEAQASELVEVDAASSLPGYEFRCQTVKILLECASLIEDLETKNQCAESGIQVLGSLMAENDEVIEVWYLLGCAFMACLPPNEDSAKYYWENAMTMLSKVKEELESTLDDDEDGYKENELEAVERQIIEVQKKLGIHDGDGGDEDDGMDGC